jgi:type IV pilus assembly protein PilC
MPRFRYTAIERSGKQTRGLIEAQHNNAAIALLRAQGMRITKLEDMSQSILHKEIRLGSGPRIKSQHFTIFCRQLSSLYKVGINIVDAVRTLSEQTESKEFRTILVNVADDMQRGNQFSQAITRYPTVFNTVFVNMVKAGEASGNLDDMLFRLAVFYEKEHYTREKIKSAMVYPIIMAIFTVIVVTILMVFVVPQLVANFEAMDLTLPLPTRIVIGISNWVRDYWYLAAALLSLPFLAILAMKRNEKGRYALDYAKLKIPVFGKLLHKQALSRFSRTFCSLFAAGVPMLQMLSIVSSVVGNTVIGKVILSAREAVQGGSSIADPFRKSWLFPPMVVHMMAVGEKSGALDSMLDKVADFYEADVDQMSDRLKAMLEPIMIVILALIVGTIVLAVMLPSFTLISNLK